MKIITVTEAKRSLGHYLKHAAAGEAIGIVSGADILMLQKVDVIPTGSAPPARVKEPSPVEVWPEFPSFDGGPRDGARKHDKYVYDTPRTGRAKRKRP